MLEYSSYLEIIKLFDAIFLDKGLGLGAVEDDNDDDSGNMVGDEEKERERQFFENGLPVALAYRLTDFSTNSNYTAPDAEMETKSKLPFFPVSITAM